MRATKTLIYAVVLTLVLAAWTTRGSDVEPVDVYFPMLEVSGSYYEIGHKVGLTFKTNIQEISKRYKNVFDFVDNDSDENLKACIQITTKYFPEIVEELRGMADGAGIPFERLFAMNMKAEIDALQGQSKEENPGCSAIHLVTKDKKYLLQNEDATAAHERNMYVVKVTTPKGITFVGLCYPGIALANGPAITSAGLMQTNNAISGHRYKKGIPRTILNRAMLEATCLDDAVKIVTHPARANSYHHNIGWVENERLLSVEVVPDDSAVHEAKKPYVHTNHMIMRPTCELPCDAESVKKSSLARYETISKDLAKHRGTELTVAFCLDALSSHVGKPYSPCRHPSGNVKGKTVAAAVFDIKAGKMTLYRGNPCTSVKAGNCKMYIYNELK